MSLIRAYGEFWQKETLNRKGRKVRGQVWLPGTARIKKRTVTVDAWQQRGIYVLHSGYKPVYVGQAGPAATKSLGSRLQDHLGDRHAGRWDTFSWYGVLDFRGKGAQVRRPAAFKSAGVRQDDLIDSLEALAIAVADPPLNRARPRILGAVYVEQGKVEAQLTAEGQLRDVWNFVKGQEGEERARRAHGRRRRERRRS